MSKHFEIIACKQRGDQLPRERGGYGGESPDVVKEMKEIGLSSPPTRFRRYKTHFTAPIHIRCGCFTPSSIISGFTLKCGSCGIYLKSSDHARIRGPWIPAMDRHCTTRAILLMQKFHEILIVFILA